MITDTLMFFLGCFLIVCGPFLGIYSYYEEGADGPTAFWVSLILFVVGVSMLAGFAG